MKVEKDVYPVGRLDKDSEGLLILTNDTSLNANLLSPSQKHKRSYFVQVDFDLTADAIEKLKKGVNISIDSGKYTTKPCSVKKLPKPPVLPQRNPPIRVRQNIPTSWALIELEEGKNRQVRKMFSSVGFPVLRLVRIQIEDLKIGKLEPGKYTEIGQEELFRLLKIDHSPKKSGIVLNTGSTKSQNNRITKSGVSRSSQKINSREKVSKPGSTIKKTSEKNIQGEKSTVENKNNVAKSMKKKDSGHAPWQKKKGFKK